MVRLAIIDIGYNAIRGVVYEDNILEAQEIFNEKFKSNISSLLDEPELNIKNQTYLSIEHLLKVFKRLEVTRIKCVATAVLRDHPRAKEFIDIVKKDFNLEIEVISGEQEAYFSAMGVIWGIAGAQGLVADLGGGSLELAEISNSNVGAHYSIALGTKVISKLQLDNLEKIVDILQQQFSNCQNYDNLYLVGGALRLIGLFYINRKRYPLKVLHYLEINTTDFLAFLNSFSYKTYAPYVKDNRQIDHNAVLVVQALIKVFAIKKIIVSNYGLKEGIRFCSLEPKQQAKDFILSQVYSLVKLDYTTITFQDYVDIVAKFLVNPDTTTNHALKVAILLCHLKSNVDCTLMGSFIQEFMLSTDITFSPRERYMIIVALNTYYNHNSYSNKAAYKFISAKDYCNCSIIGEFIKIAKKIDGSLLSAPSFDIVIKEDFIEIVTSKMLPRNIFQQAQESLKNIALARKYIKKIQD